MIQKEKTYGDVTATTPVVVALHSMTRDIDDFETFFDGIDFPLRVVMFQGEYPSGHPEGGYSWYPDGLEFYEKPLADQLPSIRTVADAIAEFLKQHYTEAPVAVMGMSQGGDLALSLAVYHPDVLSLALPMAGRLGAPLRPQALPSVDYPTVHILHGEDDAIVSVESAQEIHTWLSGQGVNTTLNIYPGVGHGINEAMLMFIHEQVQALS